MKTFRYTRGAILENGDKNQREPIRTIKHLLSQLNAKLRYYLNNQRTRKNKQSAKFVISQRCEK